MNQEMTWGNLETYIQKAPRLSKSFWLGVGSNQTLGFRSTWQPQTLTDCLSAYPKRFRVVFNNACCVHFVQSLEADSSFSRDVQEVSQEIPNGSIGNSSASQFNTQFFNFGHIVLFSAARVLRWVARVAFSFSHSLEQKLARGQDVLP